MPLAPKAGTCLGDSRAPDGGGSVQGSRLNQCSPGQAPDAHPRPQLCAATAIRSVAAPSAPSTTPGNCDGEGTGLPLPNAWGSGPLPRSGSPYSKCPPSPSRPLELCLTVASVTTLPNPPGLLASTP